MRVTPGGRSHGSRPGDHGHLRAGFGRGLRHREAHLAAAGIGDAAHGVDRLERRTRRQQHALAGEDLGLPRRDQCGEQRFGLEHPAVAVFVARELAVVGTEYGDAIVGQLRHVALRGLVRPHLPVHRRGDQQRAFAGEAQRRQEIVGAALRELGQEVRRGRRDENGVGAARNRDVAHGVGCAGLPQVGQHRTAGQRLKRRRRDEFRRGVGHHDIDDDTGLDQQAQKFRRLVRGNSAGDSQTRHAVRATLIRSSIRHSCRGPKCRMPEVYTFPGRLDARIRIVK